MSLVGTKEKPLPDKMFNEKGEMQRPQAQFRDSISSKPGSKFPPEKDRYHLYVSYGCPWAHRTLIVLKLKGLDSFIGATSVHYHLDLVDGWHFVSADDKIEGEYVRPDPLHSDFTHIRDLYKLADTKYDGRYTVPTLWDKKLNTIVSNESAEIIRMFNVGFDDLLPKEKRGLDLYPEKLQKAIDEANTTIYNNINNGVYKCGFARNQAAYDTAVTSLFVHLDRVEAHLAEQVSKGPYYFGDILTEVDVRLYTTIIRFDVAYFQLFKTNQGMIRTHYPQLHRWVRNLYWTSSAFKDTTSFQHIKGHYFNSLTPLNPEGIIPVGPNPNILPLDN